MLKPSDLAPLLALATLSCAPKHEDISAPAEETSSRVSGTLMELHPELFAQGSVEESPCEARFREGSNPRFLDGDGDGYGAAALNVCDEAFSLGVVRGGDCDDTNALISPDAKVESGLRLLGNVDFNCDGKAGAPALRLIVPEVPGVPAGRLSEISAYMKLSGGLSMDELVESAMIHAYENSQGGVFMYDNSYILAKYAFVQAFNSDFGLGYNERDYSYTTSAAYTAVRSHLLPMLMQDPSLASAAVDWAAPALHDYAGHVPFRGNIDQALSYLDGYLTGFSRSREDTYLRALQVEDQKPRSSEACVEAARGKQLAAEQVCYSLTSPDRQDDCLATAEEVNYRDEVVCEVKNQGPLTCATKLKGPSLIDDLRYIQDCQQLFILAGSDYTWNVNRPLGAFVYRRAAEYGLTDTQVRALAPVVRELRAELKQ